MSRSPHRRVVPPSLRPMDCTRRARPGFTLIELLVVVSIISLLVAILLPALQHARGTAQGMQSMSNLRQLGIVISVYAHDYGGYLPQGYHGDFPYNNGWFFQIEQYDVSIMDENSILHCPGAPEKVVGVPNQNSTWRHPGYATPYYGPMRWRRSGPVQPYWTTLGGRFFSAHIDDPYLDPTEQRVLLGDHQFTKDHVWYPRGAVNMMVTSTITHFPGRHVGADNILYLPGHVTSRSDSERITERMREWGGVPLTDDGLLDTPYD